MYVYVYIYIYIYISEQFWIYLYLNIAAPQTFARTFTKPPLLGLGTSKVALRSSRILEARLAE